MDKSGWHWRIALCLSLTLGVAGCFESNTPAITPETTEDVGPELLVKERGTQAIELGYRGLVRRPDGTYDVVHHVPDAANPEVRHLENLASQALVRRMGTVDDRQILVVQVPSTSGGFLYDINIVSIRADGYYDDYMPSCDDRTLLKIARRHKVKIVCLGEYTHIGAGIGNRPGPEDLWGFLVDAIRSGAVPFDSAGDP